MSGRKYKVAFELRYKSLPDSVSRFFPAGCLTFTPCPVFYLFSKSNRMQNKTTLIAQE